MSYKADLEIQDTINGVMSLGVDYYKGDKGDDGYTPIKGKDYFTQEEIEKIEQDAIDKISTDGFIKSADLADVATSGSYKDLKDKPEPIDLTPYPTKDEVEQSYAKKADLPEPYELPVASDTVLGGIKVGSGLSINQGVLSANGGGVADSVDWSKVQNKPDFATVATSGDYDDLSNKPSIPSVDGLVSKEYVDQKVESIEIPTKVSAFENDKGYLTEHQDLSAYAKKTEIPDTTNLATKIEVQEVEGKIPDVSGFVTKEEIPTEYVKSATVQGNKLTLTNKNNTTVDFEPSGGGSGGKEYTFTNGLTETNGTVKWDLNDKIKTGVSNVVFIGNIQGSTKYAMGDGCIALGKDTYSTTTFRAEGNGCVCGGDINSMYSKGINTIGRGNLAFGSLDGAVKIAVGGDGGGRGSVAIGAVTDTSGDLLVSGICGQGFGFGVQSLSNYQMVHGKDNISDSNSTYAHIVGNGTSDTSRSNAYTLDWQGNGTFAGTVSSSTGADYAEYFEWKDGNPNNEDRVGYIVTLDGDKIVKANTGDDVLGICSGTAMVLGDSAEWNWNKRYLTDDFGRIIYEDRTEHHEAIYNPDGELIEEAWDEEVHAPKENPEYDASQPYVKRADRPEWQIVGMMGKLYVRDDGSCIVNGYADVKDGIATKANSKTNMRVMERITDNIVRVLMK